MFTFDLRKNWKKRIRWPYSGNRQNCQDTMMFIKSHFPPSRLGCLTCVYVYTCDILYVFINKTTGEQEGPGIMYEFFTSEDDFN